MTKWESGPWHTDITYNSGIGTVRSVRVVGAVERVVTVSTVTGLKRNRVGALEATSETKSIIRTESQTATICDCGVPYAGLAAETLVANADLISAAPDLYSACDMALHAFEDGWAINWDDLRSALAKARGEA